MSFNEESTVGSGPLVKTKRRKGQAEEAVEHFKRELAQWQVAQGVGGDVASESDRRRRRRRRRQQQRCHRGRHGSGMEDEQQQRGVELAKMSQGKAVATVAADLAVESSDDTETDLEDAWTTSTTSRTTPGSGKRGESDSPDDDGNESGTDELLDCLGRLYTRACRRLRVMALSQVLSQLVSPGDRIAVTGLGLRDGDVVAICVPLARKENVREINLSGHVLTVLAIDALVTAASELANLTALNLSANRLDSRALAQLAEGCSSLVALTKLNLAGNDFGEKDAQHLVRLMQLSTLRDLDISASRLGSSGGQLIGAALAGSGEGGNGCQLRRLNLSACEIRLQGAVEIGAALRTNVSLQWLDISCNGFADAGTAALASGLRSNRSLTSLNLSSNRIFLEGAKALGDMLFVNSCLQELFLDQNSFTSQGAEEILAMLMNNDSSALRLLDMKNVSITYRTVAAAMPAVRPDLRLKFESLSLSAGALPAGQANPRVPVGVGGLPSLQLQQRLQADAAQVLQVIARSQSFRMLRLLRPAASGSGGGLSNDRARLLLLPLRLLPREAAYLVRRARDDGMDHGDDDANLEELSISSLLDVEPPVTSGASWETQH